MWALHYLLEWELAVSVDVVLLKSANLLRRRGGKIIRPFVFTLQRCSTGCVPELQPVLFPGYRTWKDGDRGRSQLSSGRETFRPHVCITASCDPEKCFYYEQISVRCLRDRCWRVR